MKMETQAAFLKSAMTLLQRVAEKRSAIPILQMMRIGEGHVTVCNLDVEARIEVPMADAEGEALVPFWMLRRLLVEVEGTETVTISTVDGATKVQVEIRIGTGRYILPGMAEVDDYPFIRISDQLAPMICDGDALKRAMAFCGAFASKEESRYYLNGICLRGGMAYATDGHRLAAARFCDEDAIADAIVPSKAVKLLLKLPPATSITVNDRVMIYRAPGAKITLKLIDGTYPDVNRVIPDRTKAKPLQVNRLELRRVARRVAVMSLHHRFPGIGLAFADGRMAVAISGPEGEQGMDHVGIAGTGAGSMAFNGRYLDDALGAMTAETLTLHYVDERAAIIFDGDDDKAFIVMMPMRDHGELLLAKTVLEGLGADVARAA